MKKKSQVTPFIIAGLVVLIMFIVLYNYKINNSEIDTSAINEESLLPLTTYVQELTENLVNEEILKIQFLGNLPDRNHTKMILNGYTSFKDLGLDYYAWDHKHSLTKLEIENYLSKKIALELKEIFKDEYLSKFYDIEELGSLVIQTSIKEDSIQIHLYKKLVVTKIKDQSVEQVNEFFVTIKSNFGKILTQANEIYNYLVNDSVLEQFAMQPILTGDFYVEGMEFECIKKKFSISELNEKYNELSKQHFDLLNFDYYIEALSDDFEYKDYYKRYSINTSDNNFKMNLKVFDTLEFSATPSENGFIEPMTTSMESNFMNLFCINIYHEFYSLKQPLIIELYYEDSLFRIPLVVDILNNEPRKAKNVIYMDESEEYVQSFCENIEDEETTIVVYDKMSSVPVNNVSVTVKCLNHYTCSAGNVLEGPDLGIPYLKSRLPLCENYEFILSKEGYDTTHIRKEKTDKYILRINPLIPVDIEYNFVTKMTDDTENVNYKTSLNSNEFISLKYGENYKLLNKTDSTIYIPYKEGVYEFQAVLNDESGNIKYYSNKILNVSYSDFSTSGEHNELEFTMYGIEDLDNTDEKTFELIQYAKLNIGDQLRIR